MRVPPGDSDENRRPSGLLLEKEKGGVSGSLKKVLRGLDKG